MSTTTPIHAIEGWFTTDGGQPALLGSRCDGCATYAFPAESFACRNPSCDSRSFTSVPLSTTGTLWSYTDACYQPPPPYIPVSDPHEPFAIAAVHLAAEGLVVLGQVTAGVSVDDLVVGQTMNLVVDTLFSDDEHDHLIWKWTPADLTEDAS